jgi:hypothetical protein
MGGITAMDGERAGCWWRHIPEYPHWKDVNLQEYPNGNAITKDEILDGLTTIYKAVTPISDPGSFGSWARVSYDERVEKNAQEFINRMIANALFAAAKIIEGNRN